LKAYQITQNSSSELAAEERVVRKEPGMLVTEWRQDMKHQNALVGSEYDVAYFVL
jgi:ribosomal protein L15E